MASYVPARFLSFAKLSEVVGPAIVFPTTKYAETFLVTAGEGARAMFLEGSSVGMGFQQSLAENWDGMAISNIELEVDTSSMYSLSDGKRKGSLVVVGSELAVTVQEKGPAGFSQNFLYPVAGGQPLTVSDNSVGFASWRAIVRDGERTIEVYSTAPAAASTEE